MSKKTKEPLPKKTIYAHLLNGKCQAVEGNIRTATLRAFDHDQMQAIIRRTG